MLSIDFERCPSKGKSLSVKARVGASTGHSVYAKLAFGIQGLLTKRELDAVGRIRVVSDQNSENGSEITLF